MTITGNEKFIAETEYLAELGTCPDGLDMARPFLAAFMPLDELHNRIAALEFPSSFNEEESQPWKAEARHTVAEVRKFIDMASSVAGAFCPPTSEPAKVRAAMRFVLESLSGIGGLAQSVDLDEVWLMGLDA